MNPPDLYLISFIALFVGAICCFVSKKRGRRPLLWFFLGFSFGILMILLLYILPNKNRLTQKPAFVESRSNPISYAPESMVETTTIHLPQIEVGAHPWYYLDVEDQQLGPVDFSVLKQEWKNEKITAQSFIWTQGMNDWQRITDFSDIERDLDE